MNFDFNDEQYMFRDTVRDTLAAQFPIDLFRDSGEPVALEGPLWAQLAELGLFGLMVPEDQGGLGLGMVDFALIAEEFGAALVPLTVTDTIAASLILAKYAAAARAENLEKLASGELRVAFAAYEKNGGYDPSQFSTSLGADGSLSGRKLLVAGADRADMLLVVANDAAGEPGLYAVDAKGAGVVATREATLDITGDYHAVSFANAAAERIGGPDAGEFSLDLLATIAALGLAGIGGRMLDTTVAYVKERSQFGQPIGAFQAIKHRCADMAVDVNTARSGGYFAAWAMASADRAERQWAVSMGKAKANRMAVHVMRESLQLHGGMGYTWEMALHFPYRRGRHLEILYGTTEYHNERVLQGTMAQLAAG